MAQQAQLDEELGDQDELLETDSASILAICFQRGALGVAAYDELENTIRYAECPVSHSDMGYTLEGIKTGGATPSLILTTSYVADDEGLLSLLRAPPTPGADLRVMVLKNSCWEYESAKTSICAHLRAADLAAAMEEGQYDLMEAYEEDQAFNVLSGVIDFDAVQGVRALGALLKHLQSTVFQLDMEGTVTVQSIKELDCLSCMRLDAATLSSLDVFQEERHPNVLKGKGRSKEGFSLFSLLDSTQTNPGRRCLKQWLRKPSLNTNVISARQDGIELLMASENAEVVRSLRTQLRRFSHLSQLLLRVKKVAAKYTDWYKICQSTEAATAIRELLGMLHHGIRSRSSAAELDDPHSAAARHMAFLADIGMRIDPVAMKRCSTAINEVIDLKQTMEGKQLEVRSGCSHDLDALRQSYDELGQILRVAGRIILDDTPMVDELSVEFIPQIGFLVVLQGNCEGMMLPEDFVFSFNTATATYFKNERMIELDESVGDIQASMSDMQASLIRDLENVIMREEAHIQLANTAVAELDALLSLASAAVELRFTRPSVVDEDVLMIKNGRHPLQELTVETFIPNDTYISSGSSVGLITGANFSGKSVYIKQVGLMVILAHVGSFIPAEKAVIGITDKIFTRISTVESCTLHQSAFTIDVTQVAKMCNHATPRSLLLIDEFGKGTNAVDGIALLAALVKHLAIQERRALMTLHFTEIFRQNICGLVSAEGRLEAFEAIQVFRMDMFTEQGSGDQIPLFKLVPGVVNSSHGLACARMGGLPEDALHRAQTVMDSLQEHGTVEPDSAPVQYGSALLQSPEVIAALKCLGSVEEWSQATASQVEEMRHCLLRQRSYPGDSHAETFEEPVSRPTLPTRTPAPAGAAATVNAAQALSERSCVEGQQQQPGHAATATATATATASDKETVVEDQERGTPAFETEADRRAKASLPRQQAERDVEVEAEAAKRSCPGAGIAGIAAEEGGTATRSNDVVVDHNWHLIGERVGEESRAVRHQKGPDQRQRVLGRGDGTRSDLHPPPPPPPSSLSSVQHVRKEADGGSAHPVPASEWRILSHAGRHAGRKLCDYARSEGPIEVEVELQLANGGKQPAQPEEVQTLKLCSEGQGDNADVGGSGAAELAQRGEGCEVVAERLDPPQPPEQASLGVVDITEHGHDAVPALDDSGSGSGSAALTKTKKGDGQALERGGVGMPEWPASARGAPPEKEVIGIVKRRRTSGALPKAGSFRTPSTIGNQRDTHSVSSVRGNSQVKQGVDLDEERDKGGHKTKDVAPVSAVGASKR
ncbi:unnamed protein product, partial [Chrysoparadoxa australica]